MGRLEEAARRLEGAVERLEAACARLHEGGEEGRRVAAALLEAKADYAALAEAAGTVATRLDGTIERINTVLDE
jgi:hypothetical protein